MAGLDIREHPELDAMLERVKLTRGSDDKLSSEELEKLEENFKDPEFRNLFVDYMKEISDPQYLREQEEYIKQMEAQQGPPPGKTVIWPTSHHVMKIKYTRPGPDGEVKRKVFVNIVSSEKIPKHTTSRPASGEGVTLRMPCATGPLRTDVDNQNKSCIALDVCFNPETIFLAQQQVAVYDELHDVAVHKSTEILRRDIANDVKVEAYRHEMKGVKYKTGEQAFSMLLPQGAFENVTSSDCSISSTNVMDAKKIHEEEYSPLSNDSKCTSSSLGTHAAGDNNQASAFHADCSGIQSTTLQKGFLNHHNSKNKKNITKEAAELGNKAVLKQRTERGVSSSITTTTTPMTAVDDAVSGKQQHYLIEELEPGERRQSKNPHGSIPSTTARHSIKERGTFDMADFCTGPAAACQQKSPHHPPRCKELVYTVKIHEGVNAKELNLDVSETRIKLSMSTGVNLIDEELHYPVLKDGGKAKYNKARHELIVTLPVNHPPASGMEIKPATGEITQETAPAGRDDENLQEEWNDKNDNESQDIVENHSRWISSCPLKSERFELEASSLRIQDQKRCYNDHNVDENRAAAAAAAAASLATEKEDNDRTNLEILPENDHHEFMPCKVFIGAKTDRVFKLGQMGLGYYYDVYERSPPFSWSEEHDTVTVVVHVSHANEESVQCQEVEEEEEKLLVLYLRFKDDHGANWGMKIYPREKIQLGCSRTNVSDENVVLVMKKEVLCYWGSLQRRRCTECTTTSNTECLITTTEEVAPISGDDKSTLGIAAADYDDVNMLPDSCSFGIALYETENDFLNDKKLFELE